MTFLKDRKRGGDQAVEKEEKVKKEATMEQEKDQGMLQHDDLPVNSSWDVRFERMLLSELVVSFKHSTNMHKLMGLHEMLDAKYTKLFEEYAEVARKLGEMEGGRDEKETDEDLSALGKGLQSELKESTELFTQGFLDYIPGLLRERSRLRKKGEERDAQVASLTEGLKGVKKEMEDLKKGKEELLKQVSALEVSLAQKSKELEDEVAEREKIEKKVEGLCSGISKQGEDLEQEIIEREKTSQMWEKRWDEILKGMEELKLSHQEKEKKTTRVTARERKDPLSRKEEERKGEQTEVGKGITSSKSPQEEPRIEGSPASEEEKSKCLALPRQGGIKRNGQPGVESSEGAGSQTET
ncbi:hypothetical protein CBR_g2 [Chara braunii]|uniref:Uncharacterized protein n=1 Tax=Chara braunii TaxID=69332 RepID=A0A388JLB2_CHABU|nr:hypothetical protein CBR_g2 [Chara braunii]|eukprot:GBG58600.1 hypothetical protein CBR_g2 [Chara braunii]